MTKKINDDIVLLSDDTENATYAVITSLQGNKTAILIFEVRVDDTQRILLHATIKNEIVNKTLCNYTK